MSSYNDQYLSLTLFLKTSGSGPLVMPLSSLFACYAFTPLTVHNALLFPIQDRCPPPWGICKCSLFGPVCAFQMCPAQVFVLIKAFLDFLNLKLIFPSTATPYIISTLFFSIGFIKTHTLYNLLFDIIFVSSYEKASPLRKLKLPMFSSQKSI